MHGEVQRPGIGNALRYKPAILLRFDFPLRRVTWGIAETMKAQIVEKIRFVPYKGLNCGGRGRLLLSSVAVAGGLDPQVKEDGYFSALIDAESLLGQLRVPQA